MRTALLASNSGQRRGQRRYRTSEMDSIGFVLLSHSDSPHLLRLARCLTRMFDAPPIVCHHDFSKTAVDEGAFPGNVRFVRPHGETMWGTITLVRAALNAIRLLYQQKNPPKWFALLSSSDYPVRPADEIVGELSRTQYDVFIDWREINYRRYAEVIPDETRAHADPGWIRVAYDRYIAVQIPYSSLKPPFWRTAGGTLFIRHPALLFPVRFFSRRFRCYGGEQWFSANWRAAEWMLANNPRHAALERHYARHHCADKSFYQCVFLNAPHLKVCADNKRYIDWCDGGSHPRILGIEDLSQIRQSVAHSARKFEVNSPVLDEIDSMLFGQRNA
jgi:Core-2/I-Branching enzyme